MRELSLNILDVVQNSVSAEAGHIVISIDESKKEDRMIIRIGDDGRGMTGEQLKKVTDPFYTTRTTRKVGLGVPLFKMAAEMTGGRFSITSSPGVGTSLEAVFVPSHVDMTPLGDINGTISLLIRCNPNLDFTYRRRTDCGEFTLDTAELRGILGAEVALNNPDVMEWIEGFLSEQTDLITLGKVN